MNLFDTIARARLARLPVTRLVDVADGALVRVEGRVELAAPPLRAPATERDCAAYVTWADIVEQQTRGYSGTHTPYRSERGAVDFVVFDGTAAALVHATRAHLLCHPLAVAAPAVDPADFVRRHRGHVRFLGLVRRQLALREAALPAGARVTVCGRARVRGGAGPYRDGNPSPIVLGEGGRVIVSWEEG